MHVPLIRTDALPYICIHPECLSDVAPGNVWCVLHTPIAPVQLIQSGEVWIYFIQADKYAVRIGKSNDPAKRLKNLQSANSLELELLTTVEARPSLLIDIQEMLKADRLRGEWYKPSSRVMAVIETAILDGVKGLYKAVREHCYMK